MTREISFRPYDPETDEKAAARIWKECGWPDLKKSRKMREAFRDWVACGTADVAEFKGQAECMVNTHKGSINMLDEALSFRAVTSVCTGRPLRRLGGAGDLTARVLARAAAEGDAVAGLGIFDQGFYDKLGFGNFPYTRTLTFDPLTLMVPVLERPPVRLTRKDLSRMVANTQERLSHHGLVRFPDEDFTRMILTEEGDGFGLGFEDPEGKLSHHFWAIPQGENGPYQVLWMVYRDYTGLLELLSLLKNLGDQVNAFQIREPWGIQFQDLLRRPFRTHEITEGGKFENKNRATSFKQVRILNMEKTLAALKLPGGSVRFNLDLEDPIVRYLPEDSEWKGLGGPWNIELGINGSTAAKGFDEGLPLVKSSVNAFSRLVFGASTPAGLAATAGLDAPRPLLEELAGKLRMPDPDMVQIF